MDYTDGNAATCKHSKRRSMTGMGKETLSVYSTCRHPNKRQCYKSAFLDFASDCDRCERFTPKK